jgi:hypothetical protein
MGIKKENRKQLKESTIIKKDLLNYLADAKFGSAKHHAFLDCMNQCHMQEQREELLAKLVEDPEGYVKKTPKKRLKDIGTTAGANRS